MRCPNCDSALSAADRFCGDCGAPRPTWPRPFESAAARFVTLKARRDAGEMNDLAFEAELEGLAFQDEHGTFWQIGPDSGEWYRAEGETWVRAEPPLAGPPPAPADKGTSPARPEAEAAGRDAPEGRPRPRPAPPPDRRPTAQAWPDTEAVPRRRRGCLVAILLLLALCLFLALMGWALRRDLLQWAVDRGWGQIDEDVPATAPAPQLPAVTVVVTPEAPAPLFVRDDFDNNDAGWFETSDALAWQVWIDGGEYHLLVKEPGWEGVSPYPARTFADVKVQARVRFDGDARGWGGLALGIDSVHTSYYLFAAYRDGSWSFEKRLGTEWTTLLEGPPSSAVKPAGESNLLQITRSDGVIAVQANGVPLGSVRDWSLLDGFSGVVAGALEPGAHLVFDDFQVEAQH